MDDINPSVIPLLVVAGPTASGKTSLSIELARVVGGEIISADSAQVFAGCDIGSAKVTVSDRKGVPHHLLDVVSPCEPFSVADFQRLAHNAIEDIWDRGRLPIVVGGTGLFIRALVRGYSFSPQSGRSSLREQIAAMDTERLRDTLKVVDRESYERIAPSDHRRLVRAVEVYVSTGKPLPREAGVSRYQVSYWVITRPMTELQQRINDRVQLMLATGLVNEVRHLLQDGVLPIHQSLRAIGYREVVDWLFGRVTESERNYLIAKHTRQYAKRQLTWFRSEPQARWIDVSAWGQDRALNELVRSAQELVTDKRPGSQ